MSHNAFTKGSEWRKWDLHTHTPLDAEWLDPGSFTTVDDKEKFAKSYIDFAIKHRLSVIAVTDHNFCDNLDQLLLPYIQKEANHYNITILPGFEITATEGSGVHFLIVFRENSNLSTIKSVVDQLFAPGTQKNGTNTVPHSNKSIDQIKEIIDSSNLEAVFIFAHADREKGALNSQTINGQVRIDLWQKPYINICQISKPSDEYHNNFYSAVINGSDPRYKREMTYIVASDCRSINDGTSIEGRTYLGEKFVWIKADPTLNGLKQIVYEPDRVKIQPTNPQDNFNKPYFSKIVIEKQAQIFTGKPVKFNKLELFLNPNLVTIIGGRGTGKSLILDAIGKTFSYGSKRTNNINIEEEFIVSYTKEDNSSIKFRIQDENNLDYLHVHQGQVKEIVEDTYSLDLEIKKMLGFVDKFENETYESELNSIIKRIVQYKEWFEKAEQDGSLTNEREYNEKNKKRYEELLSNITVESNKDLIRRFSENNAQIATRRSSIKEISQLSIKTRDFTQEINDEIVVVNKENYAEVLPLLDLESFVGNFKAAIEQHHEKIKTFEHENEAIRKRFLELGIKEDISTLFQKVEEYQLYIEKFRKKIDEIIERERQYPELIRKRTDLVEQIKENLDRQVTMINNGWDQLKRGKDSWSQQQSEIIQLLLKDIDITAEVYFDSDSFYEIVCSFISRTRFKVTKSETSDERIKKCINVKTFDDYIDLLLNKPIIDIGEDKNITLEEFFSDSGFFTKNGDRDFLRSLFEEQYRRKYVKAITKIKYKEKEPNELSIGQRGTLYVCLKLATNPFSTPFVFDQPEDDLDNQFIVNELIPIFRKLKQYRQIIIATHNANLVVNADAEQVIVADNTGELLSYVSGSLENTFKNPTIGDPLLSQGICEHVCDILEGGEIAFEKRERKYGLK